jgi:asparagine synthase (glutamine-hydrolysing)
MSGICGIAYHDAARPVDAGTLLRMRTLLAHRGRADAAHQIRAGVGLAHCSLGLEGGPERALTDAGGIQLILDGAIYNGRELRDGLARRDQRLQGQGQAETLIHAYQAYGLDFLQRLNGNFALALHDIPRQRLVLARDPMGIKPLFYEVGDAALVFASEIKAVLAGTGRSATCSHSALQEFLIFRYIAGEGTFFAGIRRLPPGHAAIWEDGALTLRRFWALPSYLQGSILADDEVADTLGDHLRVAVESQMAGAAPLGAFCSGGIDSGLVTGYAAAKSAERLPTFSVGFHEPGWDETSLARDTAARFGTDHRVLMVGPEEVRSCLPRLIWHHDEPLGQPNAAAIYLLGRLARESVAIILAGEGADELFGGYPRYQIARLQSTFNRLPRGGKEILALLARAMPGHRAARLADLLPHSFEDSLLFNSAYVNPELVSALTGAPITAALAERRRLLGDTLLPGDPIASISRYELLTYLGSALDRLDRMVMANGMEARLPFLDLRLLDWALSLGSSHKIRRWENKRVVKRLARRMLSPRVTGGRKSGFGLPLADWFRSPSFSDLLARLEDKTHPAAIHFERPILQRILREHRSGAVDQSEILWLLSNVYLWHEVRIAQDQPAIPAR